MFRVNQCTRLLAPHNLHPYSRAKYCPNFEWHRDETINLFRWKAQTMANTGSSIRAGCANELTNRGSKTARRR